MRAYVSKVENSGATADGRLSAEEDSVRFFELTKVPLSAGITLDPYAGPDADKTMLAQAIARYTSKAVAGIDTGTANSMVISLDGNYVAPKALIRDLFVRVTPAAANTGATVANVFALGSKKVLWVDGKALQGGELVTTQPVEMVYAPSADSGTGAWLILPWTASQANAPGSVGNSKYWGTPGTYTWTVPNGITEIRAKVVGAGASGTRRQDGSTGGFGGGAAGYGEGVLAVVPGSTVTIVVGAGGIQNTATYPTYRAGGASSVTTAASDAISSPGGSSLGGTSATTTGTVKDFFSITGGSGDAPEGNTGVKGGTARGPISGAPDRTYASVQPLKAGVGCGGSGAAAGTNLYGGEGGDGAVLIHW